MGGTFRGVRGWRRWALVAGASAAVVSALLLVGSGVLSSGDASGHVAGHALFAGITALSATAAALLWPSQRGFLAIGRLAGAALIASFSATQFVEGFGAFGYAADNGTARSEVLVRVHRVGAALSQPGLLLAAAGLLAVLAAVLVSLFVWVTRRLTSGRRRAV
jgi:hypothetical protein